MIYDLACVEARAGHADEAFAALEPLTSAGLALDPVADADLASLRADPRWTAFLARFKASRAPLRPEGTELEVPAKLGLVEDLAPEPRTGTVFVSSVRTGEVWRRLDGTWRRWARPGPPGYGAFALGVDPVRRVLHVTVAAVPHAEGFQKSDEGRSALVTFRLDDGRELARHVPPGEGHHLLGDLTVGPDGTVLVSDALAGAVYRLAPGGHSLEPLVPPHTLINPQTPALAEDGRTLFVPDWMLGLFSVPASGGTPQPVLGPPDLVTGGIDGLVTVPGGLLAVQNGIVRPRLVRLWLSADGRKVTRWAVLARGPEIGEPTHVVAWKGAALALLDSGWGRFTDEGTLRPDAPAARPRLLQLDLP